MLDEEDLSPADEAVLDLLNEGRVTAAFAADEAEYNQQYVRDILTRLVEHGNARKVYQGLYELVEDPREGAVKKAEDRMEDEDTIERARTILEEVQEEDEEAAEASEAESAVGFDPVDAYREFLDGRPPQKSHAKEAAVRALEILVEAGAIVETKELKEELWPQYQDKYSGRTAFWNSLDRHIKDHPGFGKPGEGEWRYTGDETMQRQLEEYDE